MALVSYINISPELEDHYWSGLQPGDRFTYSRIRVKSVIQSREKIKELTRRSTLIKCKEYWNTLTEQEKDLWKQYDFHKKKHGWRNFVSEQSQRIKYGIEGIAEPNQYHNGLVGQIKIEEPAKEVKLIQPHPFNYFILKKVPKTKNIYTTEEINERLYLPLKIGISYKANLEAVNEDAFAKFYARILHFYQGQNLYTNLEINFNFSQDWTREEKTISSVIGRAISYNLYIHIYNARGELFFDNIEASHSGANWARDIYCKKIEQSFTRGFYQVPKNWGAVKIEEGAQYKSVYN